MTRYIDFIEMFAGVAGFRLGLERANKRREDRRGQPHIPRRWGEDGGSTQDIQSSRDKSRREKPDFDFGLQKAHGEVCVTPEQGFRDEGRWGEPRVEGGRGRVKQKFRCVWSNDNDRYACQVYRKNFGPKELHEADIHTIDVDSIPDHALLTAGFPCQSFSVAGKRLGFQDTRGTLFYEILRVAEAKRPKLLLLENVRGLLSIDRGQAFKTILQELGRIGYWVEYQVLNSKHYGVPQNRQRVFIIGHLRGTSSREIFPILGDDEDYVKRVGDKSWTNSGITLTGRNAGGQNARGNYVAYCIDANYWKGASVKQFIEKKRRQLVQNVDSRIRRLTPRECERLQGFPDDWTAGVSDTQRYKCLGNAVTVNVIQFLGERILESFFC